MEQQLEYGNVKLRKANAEDIPVLLALINRAFAVERFFLPGDRIDLAGVKNAMQNGCFLLLEQGETAIASVYCHIDGDVGLIGMLSVDPARQKEGLGRRMMQEAENYFRQHGCSRAELRVVNLRTELPSFYNKLGFTDMQTEAFPPDTPTLKPCFLTRMGKSLAQN